MNISEKEFMELKKEVHDLKATVSFLMGCLNGKDENFACRPN